MASFPDCVNENDIGKLKGSVYCFFASDMSRVRMGYQLLYVALEADYRVATTQNYFMLNVCVPRDAKATLHRTE